MMFRYLSLEVLWYAAASVLALGVDAALMSTLVLAFGLHYLAASCVSFATGSIVAYVLSTRFVFQARVVRSGACEFLGFFAVGLIGLAVNAWVLHALVEQFDQHVALAKAGAALASFFSNYFLRRLTLFTHFRATVDDGSDLQLRTSKEST